MHQPKHVKEILRMMTWNKQENSVMFFGNIVANLILSVMILYKIHFLNVKTFLKRILALYLLIAVNKTILWCRKLLVIKSIHLQYYYIESVPKMNSIFLLYIHRANISPFQHWCNPKFKFSWKRWPARCLLRNNILYNSG